jgi:hypothetical protein
VDKLIPSPIRQLFGNQSMSRIVAVRRGAVLLSSLVSKSPAGE